MRVAAGKDYVIRAFAVLDDGSTELIHEMRQTAPSFNGPLTDDTESDDIWATITGTPTFDLLATDQAGYAWWWGWLGGGGA